jgi:hypothetical protein
VGKSLKKIYLPELIINLRGIVLKKLLLIVLLSISAIAFGQFTAKKSYLGPSLGFSFLGSTPEFGANYEYAIDKNMAIGGIFRYLSYSSNDWNYTYTFLGAQGNYHFDKLFMSNKWDPFVGLVLGFNSYSSSWKGFGPSWGATGSGGLYLSGHASLRYWINPDFGVQARLNVGNYNSGGLEIGCDWKF